MKRKGLKINIEVDDSIADLNGRCLTLEESVENITKQQIPNLNLKKNEYVKQNILNETIDDLEKRNNINMGDVKRIVRENLSNSNKQHAKFLEFKKDLENDILPSLNKINDKYIDGKSSSSIITDDLATLAKIGEIKLELSEGITKNREMITKNQDELIRLSNPFAPIPEASSNLKKHLQTLAEYDVDEKENNNMVSDGRSNLD